MANPEVNQPNYTIEDLFGEMIPDELVEAARLSVRGSYIESGRLFIGSVIHRTSSGGYGRRHIEALPGRSFNCELGRLLEALITECSGTGETVILPSDPGILREYAAQQKSRAELTFRAAESLPRFYGPTA